MTTASVDSDLRALSLTEGGPTFRLERLLRIAPVPHPVRLIIATVALSWAVPVVLALVEGLVHPVTLLRHLSFHARALVALPLLIVASGILEMHAKRAAIRLVDDHFLDPDGIDGWRRAVLRIRRWRDNPVPEVVLLVFVAGVTGAEGMHALPAGVLPWLYPAFLGAGDAALRSPAWWWYVYLVQPLLMYVMARFLWHWLLWSVALFGLARARLRLQASHADRAGGLGFIAEPLSGFTAAALAWSVALAATWSDQIFATGTKAAVFAFPFIGNVVLSLGVGLLPFFMLTPMLLRSKRLGVAVYGSFLRRYIEAFDAAWVLHPSGGEMTGSPDVQGLADAGTAYAVIEDMRSMVFPLAAPLRLLAVTAGPVLLLLLATLPAEEIAKRLISRFL